VVKPWEEMRSSQLELAGVGHPVQELAVPLDVAFGLPLIGGT
jgi:hypothetical protein